MPVSNPTETIDPRILRLIGLDDVFDLDYDTYLTLLKEAMVKGRMPTTTIPTEEVELLTNEYKRVKSKKDQGRFKVEKKKISTGSFGVGKVKGLIAPAAPKGLVPASALSKSPTINKVEEDISAIAKSMNSIVEILSGQEKLNEDAAAYEKRKAEQDKRALAESKLEKRFEGLKKAAEKVLAPVKSILSKIIDFLTTVFLGRVVYKLIEWFGDPQNASKVQSIIRFFGDHWPKLLSLYILFGTSFGKFARGLIRVAVKGTLKLGLAIAKLLAAKKVKGAMGAARFLGGGKGRLLGAGLTALGTAGLAYAGTKALEGSEDKAQGFRGGGFVIPRFSGGGFNNFFSGLVNGQKGVDKVPAMLSDGEFVMSRGAVAKYGVDTLEAMNAAGGGTNKPKMMSGTVYAQGGGYIGDYMSGQVKLRPATINEMTGESSTLRNLLGVRTKEEAARIVSSAGNKVPDVKDLLGSKEYLRLEQGAINKFSEGADEKTFKGLRRIYQQHFGVGEEFSKMMSDRVDSEMLRRSSKPTSTPRPKPRVTRIDPSRMLPAAGESSANAMRAAAKAAQNVRQPIPASRAIVPYSGGGLARTGVTAGLSVPQIRTNMNVPGGIGSLKSLGVELLLNYLMQKGLDYVEAKRIANQIEKANKGTPEKREAYITKLREIVDKEERFQRSFGGIFDKVIKLGGETGSEKMSRVAQTILGGLGAKTFQGGAIKGGYGLKGQEFKDMPKTQIMSDDKGRPFVGYKAMRAGKPVYVRGPQPGTGTSNPLEMLGRAINPGAYRNVDAANARKKYDEAAQGSMSSLKARGATAATIAKRQSELNKRRPPGPPVRPKAKYTPAGGGMGGGRGSGSSPRVGARTPQFSARNPGASNVKQKVLGMTS